MQNLDQIRADNALMACGIKSVPAGREPVVRVGDTAVNKLPALIVNNGLLAAAAFAEKKGVELLAAMDAVAWHLADNRIERLPSNRTSTRGLTEHLVASDSQALRLAAAEALKFLSYSQTLRAMNVLHAPQDTRAALQPLALAHCSRSLYFDRYARPEFEKDDRRKFFSDGFRCQKLDAKSDSWKTWLRDAGLHLKFEDIIFAQPQSRLMVNMAGGVMENAGLCLDRFGVPYIPGSAVKGCARRMAIENLLEAREAKEPTDKLARLLADIALVFGWGELEWKLKSDLKPRRNEPDEQFQKRWEQERSDFAYACGDALWPQIREEVRTRICAELKSKEFPSHFAGSVSFLPASPVQLPANDLELDVVTCHHPKYYRDADMPVALDTEEPNPVVFPAVSPGKGTEEDRCVFAFAVLPLRGDRDSLSSPELKLRQIAHELLRESLATFGLGAKTAAGYRWFDASEDFNASFRKSLAEAERKPDATLLAEFSSWDDKQVRKAARAYAFDALWPKQGRDASEEYQFTLVSFCLDQKKALFLAEKNHAGSDFAKGVKKLAVKFNIPLP